MLSQSLLGVAPIGKFVFSHEAALRVKCRLQEQLTSWGIRYVDLEGILPDGLVREQAHVDKVVTHFRRQGITALFLPHGNFGTEGAAGMIAKQMNVPTLLWGPRDPAPEPDGRRAQDLLCGLLASSKVLHKLGVPFTYIENCHQEDDLLHQGIMDFLRSADVANALRGGLRIGHIGQRIDFFWTTIINESELLERFGIEILPIDMVAFIRNACERAVSQAAVYREEIAKLHAQMVITALDDDTLARILGVRDQILALVSDLGLDAIALQDFNSLVNEIGAYCILANSMVSETVPFACESDIHGAISTVLLQLAAGKPPVFLTDITTRHPQDDNGVLLWHVGAPLSMRQPGAPMQLGTHWILPGAASGMPHFPMQPGRITVARFDGDRGQYALAIGEGESMEGPATQNNYVWMKVNDWPCWERQLIQGPFIHHMAMAYGHCGAVLAEACRYLPGVSPVHLGIRS
jgi:L-fucose isomerase-like protein